MSSNKKFQLLSCWNYCNTVCSSGSQLTLRFYRGNLENRLAVALFNFTKLLIFHLTAAADNVALLSRYVWRNLRHLRGYVLETFLTWHQAHRLWVECYLKSFGLVVTKRCTERLFMRTFGVSGSFPVVQTEAIKIRIFFLVTSLQ